MLPGNPSTILCGFSTPSLHLPPLHRSPDLHLLTPGPLAPVQRPLLPPDHVVVLSDPLLGKDTPTQRGRRQLNEDLELDRQAPVDWMDALQKDVSDDGDGGETEGAGEEAPGRFGGDLIGRDDWRCAVRSV